MNNAIILHFPQKRNAKKEASEKKYYAEKKFVSADWDPQPGSELAIREFWDVSSSWGDWHD